MDDRDKRDYYRLTDTIQIQYQMVARADVEHGSASDFFTSDPNFHLLKDLHQLELEGAELLRGINEKNRQLGGFLHNLNKRVMLMGQALLKDVLDDNDRGLDVTEISEGGVSFLSRELLKTGDLLALQMLFLPSMLGITCFAEVRHSRIAESEDRAFPRNENEYRIGARFLNLDIQTQRLLGRHIIRRQAEDRRKRLREAGYDED